MKSIIRKFLSLSLAVVLAAAPLNAFASDALGDDLASSSVEVNERTELNAGTFWSNTYSDLRQENYVVYSPSARVKPIVSGGDYTTQLTTVSTAAKKLEARGYRVVAGINGDYYDTATGIPLGSMMTEGVLRNASSEYYAIGFRDDGSTVMGKPSLRITAQSDYGRSLTVTAFNYVRQSSFGIYLYDSTFNARATTGTSEEGVDVVCSAVGGSLGLNGSLTLVVEQVIEGGKDTPVGAGQYVLSSNLKAAGYVEQLRALQPGERLTLSVSANGSEWNGVTNMIGALYQLVDNGQVCSGLVNGAAPRTAVGLKRDGSLVLYTIDGRQSGYSIGATLTQVAQRMVELGCVTALSLENQGLHAKMEERQALPLLYKGSMREFYEGEVRGILLELGCGTALSLDGGGSTAMVATSPDSTVSTLVDKPSGGSERAVTNHIFLVADSRPTNSVGHVYLESESTRVLPNAQVKLTATALDTNYIPMANSNVSLRADKGTIDGNILTAPASGTVTVTANAGGASAQTKIDVITQPDSISVKQNGKAVSAITLSAGETATLTASAMYRHLPVLGDNKGFTWTVQGNVGTIENGVFTASGSIGSGSVTASLGRISVTVPVTVTARALRTLDGFETSFATATGTRAMLSYNREMTRVHNGYASARLDYAIGSEGNAYIGLNYAIPSNYDQLNFWVYGDNSGAQLALVTDTGSVNLGALNFSGWKLLTANLGAATAITGMIVSSETELISAVYLDQLVLSYGGLTDTTAPKLSLQYNAASNTVTGTVKDDIDGAAIPTIRVTYDGKSYTSYTYDQSSGALSITLPAADGAQHRVSVVAGDASGNLSRAGVNAGTSSATPAFADMQDHWANDAVAYLKRSGISNGSNGNFLPDTNISRQEFAVLLARYLGSSQDYSSVQLPFADTNEIASWALNGAKAMYSLGIIKGSSDGSGKLYFNPTANVSRQEAVTMLGRLTEKGYAQGALKFTDSSAIQSWAAEYVSTLSEMGILTGFNDGSFRPNGAMTRAQVATVLYKF